jgi:hypothetical protein
MMKLEEYLCLRAQFTEQAFAHLIARPYDFEAARAFSNCPPEIFGGIVGANMTLKQLLSLVEQWLLSEQYVLLTEWKKKNGEMVADWHSQSYMGEIKVDFEPHSRRLMLVFRPLRHWSDSEIVTEICE